MMSLAMPSSSLDSVSEVKAAVESLIATVADALNKTSDVEPKSRLFFPNGIEKIAIEVKAGPVSVSLAVAGPKAP
jgi:hypothetical protein